MILNVEAENEIELALYLAGRNSLVLLCCTLGGRARRIIPSGHEHFFSGFNARQINF
jgi:hypothetical protein